MLTIGKRTFTADAPCYVIAELGHNHGGSLATAQQMIQAAADSGASAVKLQKRDNQTLYSAAMLRQPYENENSYGATYGAHRQALEFGDYAYQTCSDTARVLRLGFLATAFDEPSADFLVRRGVDAIKIASGGLTDDPLLRYVASLRVPVILSTGGGEARDIDHAVQIVTAQHDQLAVLHCTAAYPVTHFEELNLRCILTLRERYPDLVIGWSGHDVGIAMALIAYAFGAQIIEKHFTLSRASKGTDHAFSLEPQGLRKLVRDLDRAHEALGDGVKRFYPSEVSPISKMRRWYVNGRWQIGTTAEQETAVRA